jgi:hypothetical protein
VIRKTQRLSDEIAPQQTQSGAPTQELQIGWQSFASPTADPSETTRRYRLEGAVETAMPDDTTKGNPLAVFDGVVAGPSQSGGTERLADPAAPRLAWGGTGTQRITERIPISETEARVGAPTVTVMAPKAYLEDPPWLAGLALVRKSLHDPSERSAVRAWAREQVFFLRSFPVRAHQTDAVSCLILETAARLEQPEPLNEQEAASATLVVAYMKLSARGFRDPFSLTAEIARLEKAKAGRLDAEIPAFRMEMEDFRLLAELEPEAFNRAAMARVFGWLSEDPMLLNPDRARLSTSSVRNARRTPSFNPT